MNLCFLRIIVFINEYVSIVVLGIFKDRKYLEVSLI